MFLSWRISGYVSIDSLLGSNNIKNAACLAEFIRDPYSPSFARMVRRRLKNIFKPSSNHPCKRSLLPTIIGNQLCPNSWSVTPHKDSPPRSYLQKLTEGYSIPFTLVAILVATGYGYSKYVSE